jgi:hypothetical protein
MAGWKKYFKVADLSGQMSPISGGRDSGLPGYPRNDGRGSNARLKQTLRSVTMRHACQKCILDTPTELNATINMRTWMLTPKSTPV